MVLVMMINKILKRFVIDLRHKQITLFPQHQKAPGVLWQTHVSGVSRNAFIPLALSLLISGCALETEEQAEARRTQFNGHSVAEVSAVIGAPLAQDRNKAIWQYKSSYQNSIPLQRLINGKWITYGYRYETVEIGCTYTATLVQGRIQHGTYEGNRCGRYAPKLPKA